MGMNLNPLDEELYRRVDEVLYYIWDPIGVSGLPMARDEYYSYLPKVFALLKENADEARIAAYLTQVATERMGLKARQEHALKVARMLLYWKQTLGTRL